ncbi:E3 ubiquitin-protein ligase TRIM69-like [Scomber scombrus]|uniref:E3 ubiquitin-protein ligase TRIM69-like n=1 Tax=Scomber scombrus TaxID=13677 RepID=UPI002DDA0A50|nr:E3 ubiquitin-protein ligase TRIM69-like [Scomber scombrus]
MATASSFLSEDQFLCSICLDVFTEPVSVPCGHNFCKACISRHWKDKVHCQCPLCKETFSKGLKLCVNTGFREVVENFKQHRIIAKNNSPVKPGEVPCDRCSGTKFKACKTCLVCLTSYCETHLEPHERDAALMKHKLTDPLKNLKDKICKKHNRILELYCRDDLMPVCVLCSEHRAHNTVLLEEEYEEKKAHMERKKMEVEEMIQERQKKVQEIEHAAQTKRRDNDEAVINSAQTLNTLVASINRQLSKLVHVIGEKQRATQRQADMLVKELEKEITELKMKSTRLEGISHIEDQIQFIKRFQSFTSSSSHTKNWSDISIHSQPYVEPVRRALVQLEETLNKEMKQAGQDFRVCCDTILAEETETVNKPAETVTDLESLPEGIKLDTIRRQYTVDMTFDPDTANDLIMFSEDFKQVQTPHIWWCDNIPHKFNAYSYVLGKKGFSEGRFYYEVQVEMKTGWDLGVVRESMRGKKIFTPNTRNGIWIIRLRNNTNCRALHNTPVKISLRQKPGRVGVFVDYRKGLVSFYDADTATLIYSFTDCKFNEKIFPFFSPGPPEDGINGPPLVLSPTKNWEQKLRETTQKTKDIWAKSPNVLLDIIIGIIIVISIVITYIQS